MRLVHLGDLHLGSENFGRVDPRSGLSTRLFDFLRCLDTAVECAIERQADAVLFTGDAYRSREPSPTHQREFARRIHRLVRRGIPVLLVAGNHDLPALPAKASSLDVFATLEVPGVVVVTEPGVVDLDTRAGVLRCACLPALPRAALLQDEDRRLDGDALRRALSRRLAQKVAGLAQEVGDFAPSVLVAHVGIEGALLGSEIGLISGSEPTVPLEAVADSRYAYVALGHVHRFQVMRAASPPVVYCGSLDRVDFGEQGQDKGFVVVDIEGDQVAYEFIPTPARPFVTIDVTTSGPDATAEVEKAAAAAETAEAVVRLRVTMEHEQPLDEERVRAGLRDAFMVLPISKQVGRETATPRAPGLAERMTDPLAALDEYLALRETPAARAGALRAMAEKLLAELRRETEPIPGASSESCRAGPPGPAADGEG